MEISKAISMSFSASFLLYKNYDNNPLRCNKTSLFLNCQNPQKRAPALTPIIEAARIRYPISIQWSARERTNAFRLTRWQFHPKHSAVSYNASATPRQPHEIMQRHTWPLFSLLIEHIMSKQSNAARSVVSVGEILTPGGGGLPKGTFLIRCVVFLHLAWPNVISRKFVLLCLFIYFELVRRFVSEDFAKLHINS